jgi:cytochrome o ubiquinol oxidase subunit 1
VAGFALVWHIGWLVGLACVGAWATFVAFAWRDRQDEVIPTETVARFDQANRLARTRHLAKGQLAA